MIMPLTSIEVERTELRRQIKERLLRFFDLLIMNKEVEYIHILSVLNLL